jgi:toxin FitB
MRVLLDTCTVSEARRTKGNARVRSQIASIRDEDLYLSVVTLGEITKGIALLKPSKKKTGLNAWLLTLEQEFENRVLPIDSEVARIWGELSAAAQERGKKVSVSDGLIAATARRHGLHVMTRNVSDFAETGALLLNPWLDS